MKRTAFAILLVLLAGLALVFGALNHERVALELGFIRISAPVGLALIVAFAAGLLLGVLWRVSWVAELLSERGRLRRALRLAEAQVRSAESRSDVP